MCVGGKFSAPHTGNGVKLKMVVLICSLILLSWATHWVCPLATPPSIRAH
jgi:hypothetical protein